MPAGLVVRALAGFYDVFDSGHIRRCRARGVFRKRGTTVLVGDHVMYEPVGAAEGVVAEVMERRTVLVRPPVANVDQALLVFSLQSPPFHNHLMDRALVAVTFANLQPLIVITKTDLGTTSELEAVVSPYVEAGFTVLPIAAPQGEGVAAVRRAMQGKVNVFVGPSGAGKSSLGNALSSTLGLKMGDISEKLGRGKHTTRHVELFELDAETFVVDAPGFSQLEVAVPSQELRRYYPEFHEVANHCPYRGCLHIEETDCAIRSAVEAGVIAKARYHSYHALYKEIRHKEETRY